MLSNMATSLILHKRINTTVAKAKALRTYVEPLLTKGKTDSTHSRRMVFRYLKNKEAIKELFSEVAEKIAAQAIPVIGAAGGAIVNTLFIDHFQAMARGHFIVLRLEKRYGLEAVKQAYAAL